MSDVIVRGPLDCAAMGARVRERRDALGMTPGELAVQIGVSASFIGHIERGEKRASAKTVAALSEALNVAADYLLLGRELRCDRQGCVLYTELMALVQRFGK